MFKLFLRNIKKGFATNSSSYHSTLILSEEDFEKWKNGENIVENDDYYDEDDSKYVSYEDYGYDYETDITRYTSPSGDKLVIICTHGYG